MSRGILLLLLLFTPGEPAFAQDTLELALQRINSLLAIQEAISPFESRETADGTDSIEWLNLQIQEGLVRCLNHPSFQPDTHLRHLTHFQINRSPDGYVTAIGWYLNNGGTWQMQYTGLFTSQGGNKRYIPDTDYYPEDAPDSMAKVYQPLSGANCLMIAAVPGMPRHYVYHVQTVYCSTCIGERLGIFRIDSTGFPTPVNLLEGNQDALAAEYRHGSEGLHFDTLRNRILLQLFRDDLSAGWFGVKGSKNALTAVWSFQEGQYSREVFRYYRQRR